MQNEIWIKITFYLSFTLCKPSRRRWKTYVKLVVLKMTHYTVKLTLQPVLWTCQSCEVYWEENYFFHYNLKKFTAYVRMFFQFRVRFHIASFGNISAKIEKFVGIPRFISVSKSLLWLTLSKALFMSKV